mmetsp:Transcript_111169/g.325179  ORF Transcript_111169/g.325179 Transcript_111169/m.325179 type:complete len:237 (-) Transcript_111169:65-775(-)
MPSIVAMGSPRSSVPRRASRCLVAALSGAAVLLVAEPRASAFVGAPQTAAVARTAVAVDNEEGLSRRDFLTWSGLGAAASGAAVPAWAAEFPGLGKPPGPFERDPNEAVIVGDPNSDEAKAAKAKLIALQTEVEEALAKLAANPQEDLSGMVQQFGIADLREATNTVNNLMDETTAAGTQRLQRLMMQAKYQYEDDIPFPVSQKGVVQPRGEKRFGRIKAAMEAYVKYSKELLKFI